MAKSSIIISNSLEAARTLSENDTVYRESFLFHRVLQREYLGRQMYGFVDLRLQFERNGDILSE